MRVAPEIELTDDERAELTRLVQSRQTSVRLAQRARIVLLAAQGMRNKDIAEELDVGRVQVSRWRERYLKLRLAGIERDLPRGAPSAAVDVERLVQLTTQSKPAAAKRWSTRSLAAALGVSPASVSRHWRANGLTSHAAPAPNVALEPVRVEWLEDVVGLYMSASRHALVICCNETGQEPASDRARTGTKNKGRADSIPLANLRHRRTTLFAALGKLAGGVATEPAAMRQNAGWLTFLGQIDRATPMDRTLYVIADNPADNKLAGVQKWLAKHPRFHLHFTAARTPWLQSVERFFSDIDNRRLRHGVFARVPKLIEAINNHVGRPGAKPGPFIWTGKVGDGGPMAAGSSKNMSDSAAQPTPSTGRSRTETGSSRAARSSAAGESLRDHVITLKRDRILQEAAKLFFERGYLTTSVDAIAERLGATKPFVYYHFNSKVDILIEICERSIRDVLASAESAMTDEGSPSARLEQFLREFTTISLEQHQMVAIYFREEINLPREAADRLNLMRKAIDRRLSALLAEGINSGDFQIEDPRMGALVIAGMSSYAFAWYREGGRLDRQEVTDRIVKMALKLVSASPYHRPAYRVHSLAGA